MKAHYYPGMKMRCLKSSGFGCPAVGDLVYIQHVKVYPDGDYGIDVVTEYKAANPPAPAYWDNPRNFERVYFEGESLADLLKREAKLVNGGFCYSTYPFSCGIAEALAHSEKIPAPVDPIITRKENETVIEIKSKDKRRKPMVIKLWWC